MIAFLHCQSGAVSLDHAHVTDSAFGAQRKVHFVLLTELIGLWLCHANQVQRL